MKFSIRDLFLVTVIVAVCLAWWVDRGQWREQVRRIGAEKTAAVEDLAKARADLVKSMVWVGPYPPPKSLAPAPNSPKNQSGPDNDP